MKSFEKLSNRGQLQRLRQLAHTALAAYDLPKTQLRPLQHEANTTFQVRTTDGARYVLRISRPGQRTIDTIRSELLWLESLAQDMAGSVPTPMRTRHGELLVVAEDEGVPEPRVCVLLSWLDGRFLSDSLTPTHLEHVGAFAAHLHQHTANWQPPLDFVRGRVDNITSEARRVSRYDPRTSSADALLTHPTVEDIERSISTVTELRSPEDAKVVEAVIQKFQTAQHELGYGADVFGLIHADLHQDNYLWQHGAIRVIDFDDCGWGHYLFDLNVTLIEVQELPHYPALRTALLNGYRSVRPFPAAHEHYLDTFFAFRRTQLLLWVLESHQHPAFRDEWLPWSSDLLDGLKAFLRTT